MLTQFGAQPLYSVDVVAISYAGLHLGGGMGGGGGGGLARVSPPPLENRLAFFFSKGNWM